MPLVAALSLALALNAPLLLSPRAVPAPPPPFVSFPAQPPPSVDATAWMAYSVAVDAELGSVNPDRQLAPASLTKLLTAILTVEHAALDEPVTISPAAASTPVGYIGQPAVRSGEVWTVGQLLENIMVQSGNDAAAALAEHVSGGTQPFVSLMNARATEIGMSSSVFRNPNGLDTDGQVSTARDLILLGLEALRYHELTEAARIRRLTFAVDGRRIPVTSTNRDLGIYPGFLGLKTGDTLAAGQVLLSYTATANGGVLAVVLGSTNRRAATRDIVVWASSALGPRDYFFGLGEGTAVEDLPPWYRARAAAAGSLPSGHPERRARTPLLDDVDARLRELLPALLGGSP